MLVLPWHSEKLHKPRHPKHHYHSATIPLPSLGWLAQVQDRKGTLPSRYVTAICSKILVISQGLIRKQMVHSNWIL